MSEAGRNTVANRIAESVTNVEEAVDAVERAASKVESNVTEGIQPDITEVRLYLSELAEAVTVRQKRMIQALWCLAAANLAVLALVLFGR